MDPGNGFVTTRDKRRTVAPRLHIAPWIHRFLGRVRTYADEECLARLIRRGALHRWPALKKEAFSTVHPAQKRLESYC